MLDPGLHVVGRSMLAGVRCDDPQLEPFHLELRLGADPSVAPSWCQLTGRRPAVHADGSIAVGASLLRIDPVASSTPSRERPAAPPHGQRGGHPSGTAIVRRARPQKDRDHHLASDVPAAGDATDPGVSAREEVDRALGSHAGVFPALVTLAVSGTVAVLMHQPMFVLMGAVGALVAISSWVVSAVRERRRRRRRRLEVAAATARRLVEHDDLVRTTAERRRCDHPGLVGAIDVVEQQPRDLWQRRPPHGDAFTVVVGVGVVTVRPSRRPPMRLDDVPVTLDLGGGARIGVSGRHADALVRSMLVQISTTTGPADWSLLIVSTRPERWAWASTLPHLQLSPEGEVVHDVDASAPDIQSAGSAGRHLLVVTDDVEQVTVRSSAVRRLLDARPDVGLVTTIAANAAVPACCTTVAHASADGGLRVEHHPAGEVSTADVWLDAPTGGPIEGTAFDGSIDDPMGSHGARCRLIGLGATSAARLVEALAPWTDPEAPDDETRHLPTDVGLERLLAAGARRIDRHRIASTWNSAALDADPRAPLGIGADGVVEIDLVRDGPHALVAGTTGSGKSELLRALVVSFAACVPPDHLAFVLVDFKGGATFDDLTALPHVVGSVTDLEPHLAERVLRSLRAEVSARERLLRDLGCADLVGARRRTGTPVVPRLVIVVDEFAALAVEHPDLLHSLVDVARRGRSLGVHLVLATQRPSGVVSDEIRTNTDLRIALRLHETTEAIDVVGDVAPASIHRGAAGRAMVRLGPGELVAFQSARVVDVAHLVTEIAAAADALGVVRPARPWCDPLPDRLPGRFDLSASTRDADGVVGLVDRPDEQRQEPLRWRPTDGHVLVVGARGSGVTTALASLAIRSLDPVGELVVIDALGDHRWDEVAGHPRCAAVVRPHDHERLERSIARALSTPPAGGRLVVIDGLGALRRDVEAPMRTLVHDRLESLLVASPPGVTLLLGNDGVAGLAPAVVARCARRWILHLHDPADGAALGVRAGSVPGPIAGRMIEVADGSEAQLFDVPVIDCPSDAREVLDAVEPVERVGVLLDHVPASDLPRSVVDGHVWRVQIGVGHRSLAPVALEIPGGEHVLVLGPPRSGRSEVLAQFRRCWSEARPDAAQVVLAPRRLPNRDLAAATADAIEQVRSALAGGRSVLLAVDDADQVVDGDGRLAALLARRGDDLTVVAVCRAESARSAYGQWLAELRRSRIGVVMAQGSDLDGDVLGAVLPRHSPIAARPGLCWMVTNGEAELCQAAIGH